MANININGVPNKYTVGAIGDTCTDTLTGNIYQCVCIYKLSKFDTDDIEYQYDWDLLTGSQSSGGSNVDPGDLSGYQTKVDVTLETNSKMIVPAINEVNTKINNANDKVNEVEDKVNEVEDKVDNIEIVKSINVNGNKYTQENGVITLPDYSTGGGGSDHTAEIEAMQATLKRQGILIEGLMAENADKRTTLEDNTPLSMDFSVADGFVVVNKLQGEALLNVANQNEAKVRQSVEAVAGNELILPEEGAYRPVVTGKSLFNLVDSSMEYFFNESYLYTLSSLDLELFKPSTTYTIKCITDGMQGVVASTAICDGSASYNIKPAGTEMTFTTPSEIDYSQDVKIYLYSHDFPFVSGDEEKIKVMIFENDYSETPELLPDKCIDGLQSTFEDKINDAGKYEVEYHSQNVITLNGETKTLYLNSPLLEGDTIEEIDGKMYHVHNSKKITLTSETGYWIKYAPTLTERSTSCFYVEIPDMKMTYRGFFSDYFVPASNGDAFNATTSKSRYLSGHTSLTRIYACYGTDNSVTVGDFLAIIDEIQPTLIYPLAAPEYEIIDAYPLTVDKSIKLDSAVPAKSISCGGVTTISVKGLESQVNYTIQFISDRDSRLQIVIGSSIVYDSMIVAGKNTISVTTPTYMVSRDILLEGDCDLTDICIVQTDKQFDYFEGLTLATGNDVNADGKYEINVMVKSANTELGEDYIINNSTIILNSPLMKWDVIELVDGRLYHVHNTTSRTFNGHETSWSTYAEGHINQFFIAVDDMLRIAGQATVYTKDFESGVIDNRLHNINTVYTYSSGIAFNVDSKVIPPGDILAWLLYLQSNPLTIYYLSNNSIREDITDIQIQDEDGRPCWLLNGVEDGIFDTDSVMSITANVTYSNNIVSYYELYQQIDETTEAMKSMMSILDEEVND